MTGARLAVYLAVDLAVSTSDTVVWPGGTPEAERQNGAVVDFPSTRARPGGRPQRLLPLRSEAHSSRGRRGWLMRRSLLAADIVGLVTSFVIAEAVTNPSAGLFWNVETLAFVVSLPVWVIVAKLYGSTTATRSARTTPRPTTSSASSTSSRSARWCFFAGAWLTGPRAPGAPEDRRLLGPRDRAVGVGRACRPGDLPPAALYVQNTVIVGAGDVGQLIATKILQQPEYGIELRRLRRRPARRSGAGPRRPGPARHAEPAAEQSSRNSTSTGSSSHSRTTRPTARSS